MTGAEKYIIYQWHLHCCHADCYRQYLCLEKVCSLGFYSTEPGCIVLCRTEADIATTLELLTAVYEISAGAMRGLGHSLLPAIITVVGSCVLRLIWISTSV